MINLILSLDYELFGNGAGDVRDIIIEPTNRLLDICDRHGAKLTIMFEVAEYWALKHAEEAGLLDCGYSPAGLMEEQAVDAIKRGHDVQLHLHPQWIGAEYKDSLWHLNMDQYRIADLPNGLGDKSDLLSITGALYQGKKTLETMLKPHKKDYQCISFRAGGYYLQPEKNVIAAMKEVGLELDSSVVKWLKIDEPWALDYIDAYSNVGYWWSSSTNVTQKGKDGENLLELPVYSELKPYFLNFALQKLKATLKRREIEKGDIHRTINKKESTPSSSTVFQKLFQKHPHNLDFCKLSWRSMCSTVDSLVRQADDRLTPVVMIGHNKDFWNDRHLDKFLGKISQNSSVRFSTFTETLNEIKSL